MTSTERMPVWLTRPMSLGAHGNMPLLSLVLAERSVIAMERGDWAAAASLTQHALTLLQDGGFEGYWTSALVFATAARAAGHSGDIAAARRLARRGSSLRPLLTYALPVVSVQALVELANAYIGFAELGGARAVLKQAAGIVQQRPDLGTLPRTLALLQARVGLVARHALRECSSLTAAELRLAPLAPDPPLDARDRSAAPPLEAHRQVPGRLAVPEAGGLLPQ